MKTSHIPQPITLLFSLLLVITVGLGCTQYNTDFAPPGTEDKVSDIIPMEIDGLKVRLNANEPGRIVANYGINEKNEMSIEMINFPNTKKAHEIFSKVMVPKFDAMPTKYRAKVNGYWRASGKDKQGRHWYAWTNEKVLFLINARNKERFHQLVDAFKYISR